MTRLRARADDERGVVAVLVALALVGILGMLVITVDLGLLLTKRRAMVNAADASALAFAQSCALRDGQSEAVLQGDALAAQNADAVTRVGDYVVNGSCDASGTVTTTWEGTAETFFAPILGFGDASPVQAVATAAWGPAGTSVNVSPLELDSSQLRDNCGFPDVEIGTRCTFWYNNNDQGNAQWGVMNLDRWNIAPDEQQCQSAGAANRTDWILTGYPGALSVADPPPTYVCLDGGANNSNWNALDSEAGERKMFPVNDPDQQVDVNGAICTREMTLSGACNVHKYAIVGFADLLIIDVLDGNDPAAIGTGPNSGNCQLNNVAFTTTAPNNRYDLDVQSCSTQSLRYPGGTDPWPQLRQGNTIFQHGIHYTYDQTERVVTWLGPPASQTVMIRWDYTNAATEGLCGIRPSDPNAKCLVVEYAGFSTTAGAPGPGEDFGVYAINLTN